MLRVGQFVSLFGVHCCRLDRTFIARVLFTKADAQQDHSSFDGVRKTAGGRRRKRKVIFWNNRVRVTCRGPQTKLLMR